jgi:DnaJ-class molecular chaperone
MRQWIGPTLLLAGNARADVKPHPIFTRHNNDLVCQIPVSFTQAALGGSVEVPTLKATEKLELPAGTTTVRAGAVCAIVVGPDGTRHGGADPRRGAHAIGW